MTKRCRLTSRYARWAGLEPQEPTWGWVWMLALHLGVVGGVLLWAALVMWAVG